MNIKKSIKAFSDAQELIPGGVNSPVRAFKSVGLNPLFISRAKGSRIWDIDDNEYIDFVASWGPLILGHSNASIVNAIKNNVSNGTSYGAPTIAETEMAKLIIGMFPSIEMVRMVNSGTEATMSALRLARGYTGRNIVLKFEGCYHGHADSFLIKAGSGAITLGLPDSPGVTAATAKDTVTVEYNNIDAVKKLFEKIGKDIAAVIVEPVAGNMGLVKPEKEFLIGLREITKKYKSLLIFDEVITGFRIAKGGAQEYYGVDADITTLGKIIGGGLPVGAYGGKKEVMQMLAPSGPIYQAGTLSGNPLAMIAGITMLNILKNNANIYEELERKSDKLEKGIIENLNKAGVNGVVNRVGSMMTLFFTDNKKVKSFKDAMTSDRDKYARYFKINLESGIYLAPSQFECMFVSTEHTDNEIEYVIEKNYKALKKL
ncbi:MAG: glutamate-1-semialdehyde-2,1-aminomutase [Bacteroidetes bacterium GWE2_29_8]|nr:MAG: glutamate-1-semialdehyde-2,1-aminomutase [Bacteroidetes bacterium GWE2_29_8]OFY14146.1 MAG: glutamate-1-semialdehyde-2,1-aminomutase [Bacteroidetes bacterium GWF2_29_10]